mgnify:CR=1 FL=1
MKKSILLKVSLIPISTLVLSACIPLMAASGIVGVTDSLDKTAKIRGIEKRLIELEKMLPKPYEPYVPSFVDMETFKGGLYGKPKK